MRPHPSQTPIRPKVSTMPRQKTEAAAYLDIYKLVTERKRLEQELDVLEQRRERILQRLDVLAQQTQALEASAQDLRAAGSQGCAPHQPGDVNPGDKYSLLYLEY